MTEPLYIGMGPPYVVRAVIPASADFNPVAVAAACTSVELRVKKPISGAEVAWTATIIASSAVSLTVEHVLAVEDLDERGTWTVWARFTLPSGVVRTVVGKLPPVLHTNQPSA